MKYIITEEQYNKVISQKSLFWIKRRYDLVKAALKETFEMMYTDVCRIDDYEKFELKFFSVMMDELHPYFYDDENFNYSDYDAMRNILQDLFYVECTEFYFNGRELC
jgi:hypothetical protein